MTFLWSGYMLHVYFDKEHIYCSMYINLNIFPDQGNMGVVAA